MTRFRALLLLGAVVFGAAPALAQSAVHLNLPTGLFRQGNAVMMAPIADTGSVPGLNAERRQGRIRVLSAPDHDLYLKAFAAAERGDWIAARGLANQGHDATARRIVEWRYLMDKNSGATFADIIAFLRANPEWPSRDVH
jgi:soluble lytic murein transglycosylase